MEDFEDTEYVASEHDRLVSAISKLDKTQHITEPTRNEPTNLNSEFNLIKRTNRLNLNNVAKILGDTAVHVKISKKLQKTQDETRVLSKPLEKPQAERIKRATGYEETKKKVGRWDPVVARSRTVDYVSFPLKHASTTKLPPTTEFLSKFKLKSDLEKELEELDPVALEEMEEEEQIFPMSYEEMVEHRQHLAKLRAQQSYKAAKAKWQSKIKSKKYHRVLKKEKLKQQLKEFEELQRKDPEEALKKLEAIEKSRALERHTLRHKNTGKWAKNKLIRAKYDKDVRQQIAEQLAVSRSLTQKVQDDNSTDEEADDISNTENINLSQDPMNPWMMQRSDKSNVNAEFDFGYKKFIQDKMFKRKDESDSDSNEETDADEVLSTLKQSISNLSKKEYEIDTKNNEDMKPVAKNQLKPSPLEDSVTLAHNISKQNKLVKNKTQKIMTVKKNNVSKIKKPIATSNWVVESLNAPQIQSNNSDIKDQITSAFEDHETIVAQQVEKKLKEIRHNIEILENASRSKLDKDKKSKDRPDHDNLEYLKFKNKKTTAIIDEELIETSKSVDQQNVDTAKNNVLNISDIVQTHAESGESNIDPNRFIEVKPKYLNTALSTGENRYDQLDDDDEQVVPKVNIEEVFEEDDVVASFRQEKEDEINKDKPEDINLTLPGWGAWGGKGVKAPKRKRNRFILKAPPKMPRRDENKGDIIIKEFKEPKLATHKLKDVPFPFESVKDYEASIRAPLGNTFIPEKAHKKLIQPGVITKAGTIIEPMDEEELLVARNRNFKDKAVLKLVGQK